MAEKTLPWWRRALKAAWNGLRTGFGLFGHDDAPEAPAHVVPRPDVETAETAEAAKLEMKQEAAQETVPAGEETNQEADRQETAAPPETGEPGKTDDREHTELTENSPKPEELAADAPLPAADPASPAIAEIAADLTAAPTEPEAPETEAAPENASSDSETTLTDAVEEAEAAPESAPAGEAVPEAEAEALEVADDEPAPALDDPEANEPVRENLPEAAVVAAEPAAQIEPAEAAPAPAALDEESIPEVELFEQHPTAVEAAEEAAAREAVAEKHLAGPVTEPSMMENDPSVCAQAAEESATGEKLAATGDAPETVESLESETEEIAVVEAIEEDAPVETAEEESATETEEPAPPDSLGEFAETAPLTAEDALPDPAVEEYAAEPEEDLAPAEAAAEFSEEPEAEIPESAEEAGECAAFEAEEDSETTEEFACAEASEEPTHESTNEATGMAADEETTPGEQAGPQAAVTDVECADSEKPAMNSSDSLSPETMPAEETAAALANAAEPVEAEGESAVSEAEAVVAQEESAEQSAADTAEEPIATLEEASPEETEPSSEDAAAEAEPAIEIETVEAPLVAGEENSEAETDAEPRESDTEPETQQAGEQEPAAAEGATMQASADHAAAQEKPVAPGEAAGVTPVAEPAEAADEPTSEPAPQAPSKPFIKIDPREGEANASPFSVIVSQVYDGPLDLLLDLIRKQDIDIYDIPIARITAQFLAYVDRLKATDVDVAGEFIYTASLLIHIKSKMLLPRAPSGPEEQAEDPRRELVERLLEHERFKNAAQMLQQKQMLEAATWTNPGMREFRGDDAAEPEIAADTVDLVRVFRDILERARNRPTISVEDDSVTVGQMIQFLTRRLTMEDKPIALRRLLGTNRSERSLVAMFLALLELVRLQAILLRQDRAFSEIFIKKNSGFEAVMNEGVATAGDDWR